ncbi:TonB-dependent receptor, partial [Caulobacter sp.]|uniref:TonB-dependent receptor domain-containing protein n=1 Tax=Caulobacter sp. TaxID=78 RepID=UPI001B1EA61D
MKTRALPALLLASLLAPVAPAGLAAAAPPPLTQNGGHWASGHIQGIELSLQKDFTFLPAPFDSFGIYANAALIDSEVLIDVPGRPDGHVPFFNQADEIYNLQLYYERGGLSARVAWSYQGDATGSSFGENPDLDNYRAPRETVDAQISYTFANDLKLSLTGSN